MDGSELTVLVVAGLVVAAMAIGFGVEVMLLTIALVASVVVNRRLRRGWS